MTLEEYDNIQSCDNRSTTDQHQFNNRSTIV